MSQFPFVEGSRVRIVEEGHANKGEVGEVLYTPDLDGPWFEIRLDGKEGVAVVETSAGLEWENAR